MCYSTTDVWSDPCKACLVFWVYGLTRVPVHSALSKALQSGNSTYADTEKLNTFPGAHLALPSSITKTTLLDILPMLRQPVDCTIHKRRQQELNLPLPRHPR